MAQLTATSKARSESGGHPCCAKPISAIKAVAASGIMCFRKSTMLSQIKGTASAVSSQMLLAENAVVSP